MMTLDEIVKTIESTEPKLLWLVRSNGDGYFANVHDDVNLNEIARDLGEVALNKHRAISIASTAEEALSNAYNLMLHKRALLKKDQIND